MSECRFCKFEVVEKGSDEFGDYCEGQAVSSEDLGDEMTITLSKLENCSGVLLNVNVDAEWCEHIDYRFGEVNGTLEHQTGYDCGGIFEVNYCPMCGRHLN